MKSFFFFMILMNVSYAEMLEVCPDERTFEVSNETCPRECYAKIGYKLHFTFTETLEGMQVSVVQKPDGIEVKPIKTCPDKSIFDAESANGHYDAFTCTSSNKKAWLRVDTTSISSWTTEEEDKLRDKYFRLNFYCKLYSKNP